MKKVNKRDNSEASRSSSALQDALILMDECLTAWRRSIESPTIEEPQSHLDKFLVVAREGYRLMALKRGQTADAGDDIAQTCVLALIKRVRAGNRPPFVPSFIDTLLTGDSKPGKKLASYSSPLIGYLYGMLSNGVGAQARLMRMRARRLIVADPDTEDGMFSIDESRGEGAMGTSPDKVLLNVSAYQNHALALRIHDDYLDTATYKGNRLRDVLGEWTPMGEWIGRYHKDERPVVMSKRMLLLHIGNIRDLIQSAKSKTTPLSGAADRIVKI